MLNKITRFLWHIYRSLAMWFLIKWHLYYFVLDKVQKHQTCNSTILIAFLGQRICPFILCCRVLQLLGYEMHIFGIIRVKNASF